MKSLLLALITIAVAFCFSFLLIEIGIRLFVPVSDHPYTSYDPEVGVHLTPDQQGKLTLGAFGDFQADFRINNAGWNSAHDYQTEKDEGTLRIAIVGDSFIEATTVDLDHSLHMVLEQTLNSKGFCGRYDRVEVYPFGYSGSPMSQYVSIMRYVRERYDPDVYIVHIFPRNDFEPSLTAEGHEGRSHVLTYQATDQGGFIEVPHVPFEPSTLRRIAGKFATVRYLLFNLNIRSHPWVKQIITPPDFYGERTSKRADVLARLATFVFGEYQAIADGKPLLITADGDRKRIYIDHGSSAESLKDLYGTDPQYFDHIEKAAIERKIAYLPLHPVLDSDYAVHGERFEFVSDGRTLDGHWNARAHRLIGLELADWVNTNVCAHKAE